MAAMLRLENDSDALDFRPEVAGNFASPASRAGQIVPEKFPEGQRPDQFPDANLIARATFIPSRWPGLVKLPAASGLWKG